MCVSAGLADDGKRMPLWISEASFSIGEIRVFQIFCRFLLSAIIINQASL